MIEETAKKMAALVGTKEYRNVLVGWIAEGAVGLDREEAQVYCSFKEKVDDAMLREAEELVKRSVGKVVKLQFGGAVLTGQGVEVASMDGKWPTQPSSYRLIRFERKLKS